MPRIARGKEVMRIIIAAHFLRRHPLPSLERRGGEFLRRRSVEGAARAVQFLEALHLFILPDVKEEADAESAHL